MTTVAESVTAAARHGGWSRRTRWVASLLLVLHLAAVFFPPFAFQTSPVRGSGSPFAELVMDLLRPYVDAAYLNHGYAFFAPDPGPSHLLRATLQFDDGRPDRVVTLPDRKRHWPRLLYHRHFMLSEHLHASFVPPQPPPGVAQDPQQRDYWRRGRELYMARREAIKQHLREQHGAARVILTRIEHRLLDPFELQELDKRLDDADTYLELSERVPRREAMP